MRDGKESGPAFLGQGWGIFGSLACAASAAQLGALLCALLKDITKVVTKARVLQPPRYPPGQLFPPSPMSTVSLGFTHLQLRTPEGMPDPRKPTSPWQKAFFRSRGCSGGELRSANMLLCDGRALLVLTQRKGTSPLNF